MPTGAVGPGFRRDDEVVAGPMRSEPKRTGTAVSRTVTVALETVVVRGIRSRSA